MKFGFFLMPCVHHGENPTLVFERKLELIEYAESLDFDEVWTGEHHSGGWEIIPAPDIFIAAAAQRTKRIRLGTGVVNLPYHNPFDVAERMAFLDHLTYGRAMLGVGSGALLTDIKMFGLDPTKQRAMMDESLEVILRLFREDGPITHEGEYWQYKEIELQVKPFQDPHMPVAIASIGSRHTIELAAKNELMLLHLGFGQGATPEALSTFWGRVEENAAEAGTVARREDWRFVAYIHLADTPEQAWADVDAGAMRELKDYFFHIGHQPLYEDYPGQPAEEINFEQAQRKAAWMVGDPDQCIRWLKELNEAAGGFGGVLLIPTEWTSTEKLYHSLDLFARYVVPELTGSNRGMKRSWERMVADSAAGALPVSPSQAERLERER
jgi:limonene 1,2-monooxygenase